jgi:hypothetical protein
VTIVKSSHHYYENKAGMTGRAAQVAGGRLYDEAFFARHLDATLRSARIIVPYVLQQIHPRSVIDVGCARGAWLRAFLEHGITTIHGLDGDYLDPSKLLIPAADFTPVDLREMIAGKLDSFTGKANGRYDLAVCLEVAEHLPHALADNVVRTLTTLAPVVLFSAAVPGQGGIGHINEQWPDYWRLRFEEHGFQRIDSIRRRVWKDPRVHWWYRQNIFLFAARERIAASSLVHREEKLAAIDVMSIYCRNRLRALKSGIMQIARAILRPVLNRLPAKASFRRKPERFRSYAENRR